MNAEQQRIAIAEACGWRDISDATNWLTKPDGTKRFLKCSALETWDDVVPDYLHDLNAMHAAEETLSDARFPTYHYNLCKVRNSVCEHPNICRCLSATAAQRAEAFLRTIGEWKDDRNPAQ